ncbi:hypothetical protein J4450_06210 [Candidatus Micrarchaeota archaeon]|nr:hypothetical protein [Candidatus Micrarchaeota archaeon]
MVKKAVKKIEKPKTLKTTKKVAVVQPSLIVSSPIHQVECLRCSAITPIQKLAHHPTALFTCIQCNAKLDIFNNCKTCNE